MTEASVVRKASVRPLRCDLHTPFTISRGSKTQVDNCLVRVELHGGEVGWGEAAPFPALTGETAAGTRAALKTICAELPGHDVGDYMRLSHSLRERLPANPGALCAIEMAVLDALCRQWRMPLWRLFGPVCTEVKSDITVVIGSVEEAGAFTRKYARKGFSTFKIKIGGDFDTDIRRVLAVQAAAPKAPLLLDANQAYDAATALAFMRELAARRVPVALLEQPTVRGDWDALNKVAKESRVPVCADESVFSPADASRLVRERVVPAVNIKTAKCGLLAAREIAQLCRAAGVRLMIGGMVETSLSMACSAHLAAGLGCFEWIDLDTPQFIAKSPLRAPFMKTDGTYALARVKAGIGVEPRL